jgi:hypothetical protein
MQDNFIKTNIDAIKRSKDETENAQKTWNVAVTKANQDPFLAQNPVRKLSKRDRFFVWSSVVFCLILTTINVVLIVLQLYK